MNPDRCRRCGSTPTRRTKRVAGVGLFCATCKHWQPTPTATTGGGELIVLDDGQLTIDDILQEVPADATR